MLEPPSTLADLHRALAACAPYGPAYHGRSSFMLSNHLPMALHALHRLGASRDELDGHVARWLPRLLRVQAGDAAPAGDLAVEATQERSSAYLEALRRLEDEAADDTTLLARHLPVLLDVPEAAAFHGVIRVAHALQGGYPPELLRALAVWQSASGHREVATQGWPSPMPSPAPTTAAIADPFDLRAALAAAGADHRLHMTRRSGTSIVADMRVAQGLSGFERHAVAFAPTLDELAEASLATYLATSDFTALHLVTGVHAARIVLAAVPLDDAARTRALARLARAWLAAWVSIGAPAPDWAQVHAGTASEDDWHQALPAVIGSGDDHVIKLADAAREEWRHRRWAGYARCLANPPL